MKLYHYWRSSSSWRVRWALELKKLKAELIPVNLLKGESHTEEHRKRSPMGWVPALEIETNDGAVLLSESVAMIEYLEEAFPQSYPLLPGSPLNRGRIRQFTEIINAGTQPIQNLSVQKYFSDDGEKQLEWSRHWIARGFEAYEALAKNSAGRFTLGDQITLADLFLAPQVYNAKRFEVDLAPYPTISRICDGCAETSEYQASEPSKFEPK